MKRRGSQGMGMSLLKSLMIAVAAIALPGVAAAAVTYNLTLTDASAPAYSGTGVLTVDFAASATGLTQYTASQVSGLSGTIDGQTFTAAPGAVSAVQFQDGQIRDITFSQEIGASPNRYDLQMTSRYQFSYNNELSNAYGTISASPAGPSAVPEPAAWALMIVGLGLTGAFLRRRHGRPAIASVS